MASSIPELLCASDLEKYYKERDHCLSSGHVCGTECAASYNANSNADPLQLFVDADNGDIDLWDKSAILRFTIDKDSFRVYKNSDQLIEACYKDFVQGVAAWGKTNPIRFQRDDSNWDFKISMAGQRNCRGGGCVLASAFFPATARQTLVVYPDYFGQTPNERVETMAHEVGHIFGLRHQFAKSKESFAPSVLVGDSIELSIMNYGTLSKMTQADRLALSDLYKKVWSGSITSLDGKPIKLHKPISSTR